MPRKKKKGRDSLLKDRARDYRLFSTKKEDLPGHALRGPEPFSNRTRLSAICPNAVLKLHLVSTRRGAG